jgi:hypothetical protein
MKAKGNVRSTDTNAKGALVRVSSGGGMTMTKACGIGKEMVANLDRVVANAKRQYAADRKAAARDRAAEREANAVAELDSLLDDVRG